MKGVHRVDRIDSSKLWRSFSGGDYIVATLQDEEIDVGIYTVSRGIEKHLVRRVSDRCGRGADALH